MRTLAQMPSGSRKVCSPDSREMPAPVRTTIGPLRWGSATGQRLEHGDLVPRSNRIGEPRAVRDRLTVDVNRDVAPYRALVVEHIAAQDRTVGEHGSQRVVDGRALDRAARRREE